MEERYNVYFAGQVLEGCDRSSVRDKLAKVFNADQATLDKLFSGKAQLIKRNCDKATALQYREAMERAGAIPIVKRTDTADRRNHNRARPDADGGRKNCGTGSCS